MGYLMVGVYGRWDVNAYRAVQILLTIPTLLLSPSRHSLLPPQYMYMIMRPASNHFTPIEPTSSDQRESTARCEAAEYQEPHNRYPSSPLLPFSQLWQLADDMAFVWLAPYALSLIWQPRIGRWPPACRGK